MDPIPEQNKFSPVRYLSGHGHQSSGYLRTLPKVRDMRRQEIIALPEAQTEALTMLTELESNRLEVTLAGPHDATGRRSRVVDSQNPDWYRELFNQYHNGQKGKHSCARIRRPRVLKILEALSRGQYRNYSTYNILVDEIADRITNGYYLEEYDTMVPPTIELADHL